jgi:hypothetical protein
MAVRSCAARVPTGADAGPTVRASARRGAMAATRKALRTPAQQLAYRSSAAAAGRRDPTHPAAAAPRRAPPAWLPQA